MTIHPDLWLDAYLDGELDANHAKQVEAHLNQCDICRNAVEERKALSAMLQTEPAIEGRKPASRFAAEVALRLPRQSFLVKKTGNTNLAWLAAPVALLIVAVFIYTAGLVQTALDVLPGARAMLEQQVANTTSLNFIRGGELVADSVDTLRLVSGFALPKWNLVTLIAALVLTGILYCSWMAGWWARNQQTQHMAQVPNYMER